MQLPDQDEAPNRPADNKAQEEQRRGSSHGTTRHDPGKHPWDAKRQAAEDEQPYIIGYAVFGAGGFENTVQQGHYCHGQHALFEKSLNDLGFRHSRTYIPVFIIPDTSRETMRQEGL